MKIHANGRDIFSLLLSGVIWKYMLWHQKTRWVLGAVHISCQSGEVTEGGTPQICEQLIFSKWMLIDENNGIGLRARERETGCEV